MFLLGKCEGLFQFQHQRVKHKNIQGKSDNQGILLLSHIDYTKKINSDFKRTWCLFYLLWRGEQSVPRLLELNWMNGVNVLKFWHLLQWQKPNVLVLSEITLRYGTDRTVKKLPKFSALTAKTIKKILKVHNTRGLKTHHIAVQMWDTLTPKTNTF